MLEPAKTSLPVISVQDQVSKLFSPFFGDQIPEETIKQMSDELSGHLTEILNDHKNGNLPTEVAASYVLATVIQHSPTFSEEHLENLFQKFSPSNQVPEQFKQVVTTITNQLDEYTEEVAKDFSLPPVKMASSRLQETEEKLLEAPEEEKLIADRSDHGWVQPSAAVEEKKPAEMPVLSEVSQPTASISSLPTQSASPSPFAVDEPPQATTAIQQPHLEEMMQEEVATVQTPQTQFEQASVALANQASTMVTPIENSTATIVSTVGNAEQPAPGMPVIEPLAPTAVSQPIQNNTPPAAPITSVNGMQQQTVPIQNEHPTVSANTAYPTKPHKDGFLDKLKHFIS